MLSACVAGDLQTHAPEVSLSRGVRLVRRENLLANDVVVPQNRQLPQAQVREVGGGGAAHETPTAQARPPPASEVDRRARPSARAPIAELLSAQRPTRRVRHEGSRLQEAVEESRPVRVPVLRTRLQHARDTTQRALPL